jgi:MFS family permease
MQIAFMLEAFTVAILVWTGVVGVWQVLTLATLLGIASAFDIPTRQAFLVDMVGKEHLMNAIALNSSLFNAARVIGPAIAGLLIGAVGVAWCYFLNGLSYLAVIASLLMLRLPPYQRQQQMTSTWTGFREVLAYLGQNRRIRALMILTSILSIFGFPYIAMMPVFARNVLHRGAGGYGALTGSIGIGAVIGALGVAVFSHRIKARGRLMLAGGAAFGILIALFASSRSFGLSLVLLPLAGCAMIVNNALMNTVLQTSVPDHLRGRIGADHRAARPHPAGRRQGHRTGAAAHLQHPLARLDRRQVQGQRAQAAGLTHCHQPHQWIIEPRPADQPPAGRRGRRRIPVAVALLMVVPVGGLGRVRLRMRMHGVH